MISDTVAVRSMPRLSGVSGINWEATDGRSIGSVAGSVALAEGSSEFKNVGYGISGSTSWARRTSDSCQPR
jgi:hypothetical protein